MSLPLDKKAHMWAGLAVYLAVHLFFGPTWAIVAVVVAAIGKEIYDHFFGGTVDEYDIVATLTGGVVGAILTTIKELV